MTTSHSRRGFLKRSAAAGFTLTVLPKGALAQGKTKVRFSGYVESEEQLATHLIRSA